MIALRSLTSFVIFFLFILVSSKVLSAECLNIDIVKVKPYGYIDNENVSTGVFWDFLEKVNERSGVCLNLALVPYARILKSLETGVTDASILPHSSKRNDVIKLVSLIQRFGIVVVSRNEVKVEEYKDLYLLRIGKLRGARINDRFDQDEKLQIVELNNFKQVAGMLKKGRVDAAIGSGWGIRYHIGNREFDENFAEKLVLGYKEIWFQMSKKSKHHKKVKRLNKAIVELLEEGELDLIFAHHSNKET